METQTTIGRSGHRAHPAGFVNRVLVIQTAFAGDLILTLPLIQEAKRLLSCPILDVLCIPSTQALLAGHPDVSNVIVYNKKRGQPSLPRLMRLLRSAKYDVCISPHRSFRSALLACATGATFRVAFDRSAARFLYTHTVPYVQEHHEVVRNLSLLQPLADGIDASRGPRLYPSPEDEASVFALLKSVGSSRPYICIAPGSVWATKRWKKESFAAVATALLHTHDVFIVGGKDDAGLAAEIAFGAGNRGCISTAGGLSFPATAALIRGAELLISNDSAPVHLASAMGTPVIEIYGPTIPGFGFTPYGVPDRIIERHGLSCRPCGIHGGSNCPIKTFECMESIQPDAVIEAARALLRKETG